MRQEPDSKGVQIQSVARALKIIDCFEVKTELGISEIAEQMQLSRSTVFGLVNTLAAFGYLEQTESSKKYRLGLALFEQGSKVISRIDIRDEAKKLCVPIAKKYSAAVHIATHSAGEVIYLDKLNNENYVISASSIGLRAPMHCTGVGKAMLAFLPEEYFEQNIKFPLKKYTENTITDRTELLEELKKVRAEGFAADREEIEYGLSCIAVPVMQKNGIPAISVSISFPTGRTKDIDLDGAKKDLLACADALSLKLGYRG